MGTPAGNVFDKYDHPSDAAPTDTSAQGASAGNHFDQYDQLPPAKPTYDPTEGMSTTDKFMAGAGKSVVDTGRGIYQLGASIGHAAGMVSDEKMRQIQADVDESKQRDAALMNTTAGTLGNIAGGVAQFAVAPELLPAKLATKAPMLANAAAGALFSGAQPTATGESRLENTELGGIGGAAGSAAGKAIGWLAQPIKNSLSVAGKAAADTLQKAGIPLDLAQQTGSRVAQTIKNVIADNPIIGHSAFPEEQGHAFNRAALKTMGVEDPAVTLADEDTMAAGKKQITGAMDDVEGRTHVNYDSQLENDLTELEKSAPRRVSADNLPMIRAQINNVMSSAAENNEVVPGAIYSKLRSELGGMSADPKLAPVIEDLQEALDDAVHRSVAPEDIQTYATARKQYRAMKQIEKSINPATGNINPVTLIGRINTAGNRGQALYGEGDQSLVKLAKAAKNILGENNPNSGTARRLAGMAAMGAVAGGTSEILHGDPREAMKYAAIGAAAPWVGRQLVENPAVVRNYLKWNASPTVKAVTGATRKGLARTVPAAINAENQPDQPDIQRASGGRVDTDALVNRLINRWKQAKKATNETTKPLLKMDDSSVAKALEVASNAI